MAPGTHCLSLPSYHDVLTSSPGAEGNTNGSPKLQIRPKGTRREKAGLSTVFVGLAIRIKPDKREYAIVIHDGQGVVGCAIPLFLARAPLTWA
jgi:hypothetical protein